jgi:hypothetical protein
MKACNHQRFAVPDGHVSPHCSELSSYLDQSGTEIRMPLLAEGKED